MAERKALVFEQLGIEWGFETLCCRIEELGLRLEHPSSGSVMTLDEEGCQYATNRQELLGRLLRGEEASFQFWYSADHDLYCRVRRSGGVRVIEFGMEGTTERERSALLQVLEDYVKELDEVERALGLVFDPEGVSEDYDWDCFFVRSERLQAEQCRSMWPALLVVNEVLADAMDGFKSVEFSVHLIAQRIE